MFVQARTIRLFSSTKDNQSSSDSHPEPPQKGNLIADKDHVILFFCLYILPEPIRNLAACVSANDLAPKLSAFLQERLLKGTVAPDFF